MAKHKNLDSETREAMYGGVEGWNLKWNLIIASLAGILLLITLSKLTGTSGQVLEWLNLLVRWFHIIVGIAWIGASFYFIWLENSLEREDIPEHLAGNVYSVHGGGFYYIEKYKVAPPSIPEKLHWFQWDAYLTFLSGFGLLMIVYYANAEFVMVNPRFPLPALATIVIGLVSLTGGWLIYDRLCKAKIAQNKPLFALLGFLLVTLIALILSLLLSGRAAYMHVGAMLGTIMAANVFFNIIPAHRVMVKAAREGVTPDPSHAKQASLRSLHNNYMTLPVIFIMISNHFPSTFGQSYSWIVLALLFLASAGVRHYLNLHERGQEARWILPAASLIVLSLALV
ncbi:MAG: urate hydroxylase PuuD, partial [Trueperaceae bacterium]|nr:urate hydroxylase PuuD [Trueperaceae bacterium]